MGFLNESFVTMFVATISKCSIVDSFLGFQVSLKIEMTSIKLVKYVI